MEHHFERLWGRRRGQSCAVLGEVAVQGVARQAREQRRRPSDGRGISGVGFDQDLGVIASNDATGEIGGDGDSELDLTVTDRGLDIGLAVGRPDDLEIARMAQSREHRTGHPRLILHVYNRGQMPWVIVDRVAEQQQLDHRHQQHHGVGQPVAAKLGELLEQHSLNPAKEGRWAHGVSAS